MYYYYYVREKNIFKRILWKPSSKTEELQKQFCIGMSSFAGQVKQVKTVSW